MFTRCSKCNIFFLCARTFSFPVKISDLRINVIIHPMKTVLDPSAHTLLFQVYVHCYGYGAHKEFVVVCYGIMGTVISIVLLSSAHYMNRVHRMTLTSLLQVAVIILLIACPPRIHHPAVFYVTMSMLGVCVTLWRSQISGSTNKLSTLEWSMKDNYNGHKRSMLNQIFGCVSVFDGTLLYWPFVCWQVQQASPSPYSSVMFVTNKSMVCSYLTLWSRYLIWYECFWQIPSQLIKILGCLMMMILYLIFVDSAGRCFGAKA